MKKKGLLLMELFKFLSVVFKSDALVQIPRVSYRILGSACMDPPDILKKYPQYLKENPNSIHAWGVCGLTLEFARKIKAFSNQIIIILLGNAKYGLNHFIKRSY